MLQFRQIQAFHAIMDTHTVTRAAKRLGISQPGVSNLIANLEHELGFDLFKRISGRLYPTAEAYRLSESTQTAILGFEQLRRQARAIQNLDIGKLEIAALPELSMQFIPREIHRFIADKPDINISFQTRSSTKIQQMVSDHIVEIGIAEAPVEHENLKFENFSFDCVCILPENHHLAHKSVILPEDLHREPLITLGPAHMTYHRLREIFKARDCIWNDRCQTRLFHSAMIFVQGGLGAALVDPFTIESPSATGLVVKRFDPVVAFDLAIIWASDRPVSILGQAFINELKNKLAAAKLLFESSHYGSNGLDSV